jgi:hypothetical protein
MICKQVDGGSVSNRIPSSLQVKILPRHLPILFGMRLIRLALFSLPRICNLERLVQMGMFSLKTPSCTSPSTARPRSHSHPPPASSRPLGRIFASASVLSSTGSSDGAGVAVDNPPQLRRSTSPGSAVVMSALRMLQQGLGGGSDRGGQVDVQASPSSTSPQTGAGAPSMSHTACPVCSSSGQAIARTMPCALRAGSRLRCRGSGEIMDQENPPLALPNGQVYSKAFVLKSAFPAAYRKRKSRYLSTSSSSSPCSGADTAADPGTAAVGEGGARDAITILLNFRRARLGRGGAECSGERAGEGGADMEEGEDGGDSHPSTSGGVQASPQVMARDREGDMSTTVKMLFTCPTTHETFEVDQLRPVYIA